jgi:hypothetical protein
VKEAAEREAELVRQLEEVREQMVRDAQAAAAREDRLRRDVRELEARCQVRKYISSQGNTEKSKYNGEVKERK